MKRFILLACSMIASLFAEVEMDDAKVLEALKSNYKKHEVVFMVRGGRIRVFKESDKQKAPLRSPKGVDLIVFEQLSVRSKDGKSSLTREWTMRIVGAHVFCSLGIHGKVFKAPVEVVENALEKLSLDGGFEPAIRNVE